MPAASDKSASPKTRSKLRLALAALAPVVLSGGGYAGWAAYAGQANDEAAAARVVVPPEVAAESSFTQAFALAVLIAADCGRAHVPALRAASDAELRDDGSFANLSWLAAARRVAATTDRSCGYLRQEVREAEFRAAKLVKEGGTATAAR